MLVQYFLQCVYKNKRMSPPATNMTIDGVFGPVTKSWIFKFQWDAWYDEKEIHPDGTVCPFTGEDIYSFVLSNNPTILFLNAGMMNFNLKTYLSLARHQSVPRLLRKAISRIVLPTATASLKQPAALQNLRRNYFSGNNSLLNDFCIA
jgi:hypothetical protein